VSLTYSTFVTSLANLISVEPTDPGYLTALPNIIDDAEQRLYRELDLLSTMVTATGLLTSGSRKFTLPTTSGTFVVVEEFNVITPAGITNPELGERVACDIGLEQRLRPWIAHRCDDTAAAGL